VESVAMLARIAAAIEPRRPRLRIGEKLEQDRRDEATGLSELIASSVDAAIDRVTPALVIVPTRSGATARSISRYRLPVWILGVSSLETTCRRLQFTYGVFVAHEPDHPEDWKGYARRWMKAHGVEGDLVILTEGPSSKHPEANNRMELIDLRRME